MADHYDAEVRRLHQHFRAALGIRPTDQVLDVGCGGGQSTRDAALAARSGGVLGIDVSERMLDRARRLTAQEGLTNVAYELGDAQVHPFPRARFDVMISRFGTMFFEDPVAAFRNLAGAAKPGARLVMLVWQSHDRNEWATAVDGALTGGAGSTDGGGAFSLADPSVVKGVLGAAGFAEVGFTEVHEPVYYGANSSIAYDLVLSLQSVRNLLAALDPAEVEPALARLRATLETYDTGDGVWFDAYTWIVTARREP